MAHGLVLLPAGYLGGGGAGAAARGLGVLGADVHDERSRGGLIKTSPQKKACRLGLAKSCISCRSLAALPWYWRCGAFLLYFNFLGFYLGDACAASFSLVLLPAQIRKRERVLVPASGFRA